MITPFCFYTFKDTGWVRIFQRSVPNLVAKPIASGFQIFTALAPTTLPMDYGIKAADTAPLSGIRQAHRRPIRNRSARMKSNLLTPRLQ